VPSAVVLKFKKQNDLAEELRSLRSDMINSVAWKATIAAASVVKRKAIANAARFTEGEGHLAKHIAVVRNPPSADRVSYSVGVRAGAYATKKQKRKRVVVLRKRGRAGVRKLYFDDPYYWWMQEFGFKHHGKAGSTQVGPNPFITPAMLSERQAAMTAMQVQLKKRIDKVNKQRGK